MQVPFGTGDDWDKLELAFLDGFKAANREVELNLPDHLELENLEPYKHFTNEDYYRGYKAGMPEGAKHVLNKILNQLKTTK